MKSLTEQLKFARRSLAKRLIPRLMTDDAFAHDTACLVCIVATLEKCVLLEEVSNEMKAEAEARERLDHSQQFARQPAEAVL